MADAKRMKVTIFVQGKDHKEIEQAVVVKKEQEKK